MTKTDPQNMSWCGRLVNEMSREELIATIRQVWEYHERRRAEAEADVAHMRASMLGLLRSLRNRGAR